MKSVVLLHGRNKNWPGHKNPLTQDGLFQTLILQGIETHHIQVVNDRRLFKRFLRGVPAAGQTDIIYPRPRPGPAQANFSASLLTLYNDFVGINRRAQNGISSIGKNHC
ncbi:MAG: hypothetical protein ACYCZT_05075 [Thiobacillus sp.]